MSERFRGVSVVSVGLNRTRGLFWVVVETVTSVVRDPLTDANVEWEDASLVPLGSAVGLLSQIAGNCCHEQNVGSDYISPAHRIGTSVISECFRNSNRSFE